MHIQYLYSLLYWQDSPNHESVKGAFIKITGFAGKCFLFSPPLPVPSPSIFCSHPNFRLAKKRKMPRYSATKEWAWVICGYFQMSSWWRSTYRWESFEPASEGEYGYPTIPSFYRRILFLCSFHTVLRIRGFRLLKGKGILFFRKEANNTRAALFKEQFSILLRRWRNVSDV